MNKITIKTPENIEFSYELAGLGSRFLAILIDTLAKTGAIFIVWATLYIVVASLNMNVFSEKESLLKSSLTLTILFLGALAGFILIGYHIFFETLWNGQTLGKRIVGLRVIKENGSAINIFDSTVRNFLRIVDFAPSFYILGSISILCSKRYKRIGDLAAGTLVVKIAAEPLPLQLPEIEVENPVNAPDLRLLEETDYNLARYFIMRRNNLKTTVRKRLAKLIAETMLKRWSLLKNPHSSDEELLEWIVMQYPLIHFGK